MADLRVLVVDSGRDLGGAQLYLLRLNGLLGARGVEQVLAAPAGSELARAWRAGGGEHVGFETANDRSIRRGNGRLDPVGLVREVGRTGSAARQLAALADQTRAEVLHGNGHWTHLEVAAAGRLSHRPAVLHLHERSRPDPLGRLRAISVRGAAATVAVSDAVARSIPSWARARVRVVRSGVDTDQFRPGPANPTLRSELTGGDPGAAVVLVLARLVASKGIDHVIRAVAGLPGRLANTHLAIAGPAPDTAYARSLREEGQRRLGARVHFLGPRGDAEELLRASDALVLASESEGLGLCILEAQASGVPVIAYPAGGCAEIVRPEDTGLLAAQGDERDLGRQLDRLLSQPELAQTLARQALAYVRGQHSIAEQADKNVDILHRVSSTFRFATR